MKCKYSKLKMRSLFTVENRKIIKSKITLILKKVSAFLKKEAKKVLCYLVYRDISLLKSLFIKMSNIFIIGFFVWLGYFGICFLNIEVTANYSMSKLHAIANELSNYIMIILAILYLFRAWWRYHCWDISCMVKEERNIVEKLLSQENRENGGNKNDKENEIKSKSNFKVN